MAGDRNYAQHITLAKNKLEKASKQGIQFMTPIGFVGTMQLCNIITLASTLYSVQQCRNLA
jgi:hypothetical protein